MADGFVKLHRKMLEWEWADDPAVWVMFTHLLILVNWKPKKWHGIEVERGAFVTSRAHLSTYTGLTEQQVRTSLEKLQKTGEIEVTSTNLYTVIKVLNYAKYQTLENDEQPTNNQQITSNQPTNNQRATNEQPQLNNSNKEKKERKKEYYRGFASSSSSSPLVIETPYYYRQQKAGTIPEPEEPSEDLLAQIAEMQKKFGKP